MTPWSEVARVLDALESVGVRSWVVGGWGVDVLVGRVTRAHRDLDLLVDATSYDVAMGALADLGYSVETDWLPLRIEVAAPGERWVDVHPVVFDERGHGLQGRADQEHYRYPPDVFTTAAMEGRVVPCVTAELQWSAHQGYDPRPQDEHDLDLLAGLGVRP